MCFSCGQEEPARLCSCNGRAALAHPIGLNFARVKAILYKDIISYTVLRDLWPLSRGLSA